MHVPRCQGEVAGPVIQFKKGPPFTGQGEILGALYTYEIYMAKAGIGENRQVVTNEPVQFEKSPVEVGDCRKVTDRLRGVYRILLYPN